MSVLITGASGFLGWHLRRALDNARVDYLAPSRQQLDLMEDPRPYFEEHKPEAIIHLAAVCGGIGFNKKYPADLISANTRMAINLFDAVRLFHVDYLISLGSVCAYPKHTPVPFMETSLFDGFPEETNAPYGISKRLQLIMHQAYRAQYGLGGCHLVPVNMYGEHDHFDLENSHVIPALIRKFSEAKAEGRSEVECWGTGKATREFLYAGDAAKAIVRALKIRLDSAEPINVGTGEDTPIFDLAHNIAQTVGYTGEVVFTGEVSDGQPERRLNIDRALEWLGYQPTVDLDLGLSLTVEWYNQQSEPPL